MKILKAQSQTEGKDHLSFTCRGQQGRCRKIEKQHVCGKEAYSGATNSLIAATMNGKRQKSRGSSGKVGKDQRTKGLAYISMLF